MRESRSPCNSPITHRQLDTLSSDLLGRSSTPLCKLHQTPWPPKRASQPTCDWFHIGESDVTSPITVIRYSYGVLVKMNTNTNASERSGVLEWYTYQAKIWLIWLQKCVRKCLYPCKNVYCNRRMVLRLNICISHSGILIRKPGC